MTINERSSCHRPLTTHLLATTASSQVAMAASQHLLHPARCSATAKRPIRTSPPAVRDPVSTYTWVSNFGRFLTSKKGVNFMRIDLYTSITYGKSRTEERGGSKLTGSQTIKADGKCTFDCSLHCVKFLHLCNKILSIIL